MLSLFSESFISEGLVIGGNFAFHNEMDLTIKTAFKKTTKETANTNSPWVIFGRAQTCRPSLKTLKNFIKFNSFN